jgi:hypothetical protein
MRGLSFLNHEGHVGSPNLPGWVFGSEDRRERVPATTTRERDKIPLSFFLLGWYDRYAAFFCCLTFAQRARCAAAILLRPARLIVCTFVGAAVRLVFAHRAFCASEIFRRAVADSVRFVPFGFVRIPVPFRPTKLPIAWMTWSRRARSCSSSFNIPARSAMVFPPHVVWNNRPSIVQTQR